MSANGKSSVTWAGRPRVPALGVAKAERANRVVQALGRRGRRSRSAPPAESTSADTLVDLAGMNVPSAMEVGVGLSRHTTLGTGGPARFFARPGTLAELEELLAWADVEGIAVEAIGLGSNLLVHDGGVDALVLRLGGELAEARVEGTMLVVGGGAANAVCLHRAREAGLGGFEFASAIPGTAGGGMRMNAGAYGSDWRAVPSTRSWSTPRARGRSLWPSSICRTGTRGSRRARSSRRCASSSRRGRSTRSRRRSRSCSPSGRRRSRRRSGHSAASSRTRPASAGRGADRGLRAEGAPDRRRRDLASGTRTSSRTPAEPPPPTRSH